MLIAMTEWGENKKSISTSFIKGKVEFSQREKGQPVMVYLRIEGLPDGVHGFHIHEKPLEDTEGDVMDCCDKLGGHFNVGPKWSLESQNGTKHGDGMYGDSHTGDLCNNIVVENNFCETYFMDHKISLFGQDERCIIGRSIVIHEERDDMGIPDYLDDKKNIDKYITGNAGKRIACGNIELV